ncbi:hypothetical protein ACHAWU_009656 [Discostella pseudostelligera]|uniref:Uncharacterized protein n=1 Tax=Discostella pseudostelligera TaxID=259834 RepID=A0ABD3MBJ9_9STRA
MPLCNAIVEYFQVMSVASTGKDVAVANVALIRPCNRRQWHPMPVYSLHGPIDRYDLVPPAMLTIRDSSNGNNCRNNWTIISIISDVHASSSKDANVNQNSHASNATEASESDVARNINSDMDAKCGWTYSARILSKETMP